MQKVFYCILLVLVTASAYGQKGVIKGKVTDQITGEDIIGANVSAVVGGSTVGTATDINGNFSFQIEPGTHTVSVSYIGYKTLEYPGILVASGQEVVVNATLESSDQQLEEVVVRGQADRASETALLMDRKQSLQMVQNIGAIELARKGVDDAEAAVTQITGVSKQEGVKNVFVRGLGDRYNSTSLNGLPLPSEDPAFKNITLSFFSTDIINSIEVNKTFNAGIYGDVAGANINIIPKELFDESELEVSASTGVNWQTVDEAGAGEFYTPDGVNYFGFVGSGIPVSNLNQYSFENSFKPDVAKGPLLNNSLSISGGKSFYVKDNALKVYAVAAMSNDYNYKVGDATQINQQGAYRQDLTYDWSRYYVAQFGLANVSYGFGKGNEIAYNALYIHSNEQNVYNYRGFSINGIDDITEPNAYDMFIRRQSVKDNTLLVNQLLTTINLSERLSLRLNGSYNTIRGDEPDRRQNWLIGDLSGESYRPNNSSPAFNHRFFSTLKEDELVGDAALTYYFTPGVENNKIVVGYNYRLTDRDFNYVQFNFDHAGGSSVDPENPEAYYNQDNLAANRFDLETSRGTGADALSPFFYTGDRSVHGGFVSFEYDITPELTVAVGSRIESIQQKVVWSVGGDPIFNDIPGDNTADRDNTYILPSVNVKYNLTENDQLRIAGSKTYTYPQFKEVAPFLYEDVNENIFGNTGLRPAENLNLDIKYEHYFGGGGLVAVTGFFKSIKDAINQVQVNSAALEHSYLNTGDARVVGAEMEFKRTIFEFKGGERRSYVSSGVNVSYLHSRQDLKRDPTSAIQFDPTYSTSQLEGASPWLVNADLTYNREGRHGKITSAVVFSYFSKRIYSLGVNGLDHIYELPVPMLDWISKFAVSSRLTLSLNVRNILDQEYVRPQGILDANKVSTGASTNVSSYQRGRSTSIGISYKF